MATIKVATLNLNGELRDQNVFTVKLDAWKQTFYYWGLNASKDVLTLDGLNLAVFAHDLHDPGERAAGNGPFVLEFGGAFYKGKPIQLDDQITFQCGKFAIGQQPNCNLLCVKQYFVEDRPGPDKTITDAVSRNLPGRKQPPAGAYGPRTITERPTVSRSRYGRTVRPGSRDR